MSSKSQQKEYFEKQKQHDYFRNQCVLPTPEKLEEVFYMVGCQDEYEEALLKVYHETTKGDC